MTAAAAVAAAAAAAAAGGIVVVAPSISEPAMAKEATAAVIADFVGGVAREERVALITDAGGVLLFLVPRVAAHKVDAETVPCPAPGDMVMAMVMGSADKRRVEAETKLGGDQRGKEKAASVVLAERWPWL